VTAAALIPGGGATVFSSPPLCRARGLCFFSSLSVLSCFSSPSLVLLALAALMVAGWRCCCGDGKKTRRWCPGGEERSFFFSVLRPPVSVLLFPTSVLAFSPLSLKQIFLFFFSFPSVSVSLLSTLEILPPLFCSLSVSSLSLLFLYFWTMMVLSVVAGRSDGGAGGGATVALVLPLLTCSFTLLSPFSPFFFCFARVPPLSYKLSPLFSLLPPPLSHSSSVPSPKFCHPLLFSLPLLFISRKRRCPPCSVPSWCRGETGCLTSAG